MLDLTKTSYPVEAKTFSDISITRYIIFSSRDSIQRFGMHLLKTMQFVSHTCPRTAKKDIQVNGMLLTTKFIVMNTIQNAKFIYLFASYDFIYTGDVVINATYRLTDENALELSFIATTTKATPINLSSHCYFNLGKKNGQ